MACSPVIPNLADAGGDDDRPCRAAVVPTAPADLVPDEEVEELPGVATDSDILFQDDLIEEFWRSANPASTISRVTRTSTPRPPSCSRASPTGRSVSGPRARTPGGRSAKSSWLDFNRYEGGPDRFLGMKGLTFQG